ncbi:polysaccharide biosynthesis tyrosine autokinase [Adhaeribacter sp. BT258]|uniref:non-specific protein-tyrosine kinase n=1 Tax=Adhaeribacter terrigena TaxID=2793070 RepID=A0ABS1BXW5_9BACT|nr:polysaccharide biosynthesis tyrosine autokinase [Adhaeribacter terrigena]
MNKDKPRSEENLFAALTFRFLPYWPLFLILLLFAGGAAWAYLKYYASPTYQISATLLIKDEKKGINDPKMMEEIDGFTSSKLVDNEMKVIQSRILMNKVVDSLKLYAPIYEQGQFKVSSAYTTSPVRISLRNPNKALEYPQINFRFNKEKNQVIIGSTAYALNEWVSTPYGEMLFTENPAKSAMPAGPLYFAIVNPRRVANELLMNLAVEPSSKLSTVINLALEDQVPQRGEDILNHLIYAYNDVAIADRNELAANTMNFIEGRIKVVEDELTSVEDQVEQFKSSAGVVNLDEQGKLYLQNVGDNDRKLSDINMKLAVLKNVEAYVISKRNTVSTVPSTLGVSEPVLSQLLQKLYEAELRYQALSKTTAENNPLLLATQDEINKARPSILENIRNQRANLLASRADLMATNNSYRSALQTIPQKERALLEISREMAIKNNAYSFLLQKREETALAHAPTANSSRVVDMAQSSVMPVNPKPIQVYAVAMFLSLALGIGFVTTKEQLTSKLLFRSDIEDNTTIPIITELSDVKRKEGALFTVPGEVYVIEQFRQMRATMGLFGRSFNRKKIMVTSSIAGEGKSFVSSNLAYSLASSGKKVVLIDFDLRSPNASQLFNCFRQTGLTEYLTEDIDPQSIVCETGFSNLSIIPAGTSIGDHTELLLNGKLETFFAYVEKTFDYIIIDTPPVELVSDAYLLAEYCDATLFVMRHAFTPKSKIKHLNQNTQLRAVSNLGIVFTGVKARGFIKGDYGYGYGSAYGYKYGAKFKRKEAPKTEGLGLNLKKLINYNTSKATPDLDPQV